MYKRQEEKQERFFREQLRLACKLERPVIIHCLRAWGRLLQILKEEGIPQSPVLFHAYSGPVEILRELQKRGAYFSFAPDILYEKKKKKRQCACEVSLERLLVESDAPYFLPPPQKRLSVVVDKEGREFNHPVNVKAVLSCLSKLRGQSLEFLAASTFQNTRRFLSPILG